MCVSTRCCTPRARGQAAQRATESAWYVEDPSRTRCRAIALGHRRRPARLVHQHVGALGQSAAPPSHTRVSPEITTTPAGVRHPEGDRVGQRVRGARPPPRPTTDPSSLRQISVGSTASRRTCGAAAIASSRAAASAGSARRSPCRAPSRTRWRARHWGAARRRRCRAAVVGPGPPSTRSSFHARLAASRTPAHMPWPANGGIWWAASPAISTRPRATASA
jgi:hypothetical protein